ncbi:hypothetical protein ACFQY4_15575 [Catellatospora bangladeshensis]|uniref:hypothetical protein n=1 Tax=Catellatospora bangladeshensis TaxID=310355 RepID=UPI0036099608
MISTLLALIALCMLALAATAVRLRRAAPLGAPLVAVICAGLAYDCAAIAIGRPSASDPRCTPSTSPATGSTRCSRR